MAKSPEEDEKRLSADALYKAHIKGISDRNDETQRVARKLRTQREAAQIKRRRLADD
jgi:hypothetical protein